MLKIRLLILSLCFTIINLNAKNIAFRLITMRSVIESDLVDLAPQIDYSSKINLQLLDSLIGEKLNNYRVDHNVSPFEINDTIIEVAKKELVYTINHHGEKSDNLLDYLKYYYDDNIFDTYSSNVITFWHLDKIDNWNDVEERLAAGYLLQYILDNKTKSILVNKNKESLHYHHRIGITSQISEGILFISEVVYIN